jgi:hypothetical protein
VCEGAGWKWARAEEPGTNNRPGQNPRRFTVHLRVPCECPEGERWGSVKNKQPDAGEKRYPWQ